jgi:hypothetical protein
MPERILLVSGDVMWILGPDRRSEKWVEPRKVLLPFRPSAG